MERSWLTWDKITDAADKRFYARIYVRPSLRDIDACLSNNEYPMIKYLIGGIVQHWVTIAGKEGQNYYILTAHPTCSGRKSNHPFLPYTIHSFSALH